MEDWDMLNRKTVFILGAGFSHEVSFPLGTHLRNEIRSLIGINPSAANTRAEVGQALHMLSQTFGISIQDSYKASSLIHKNMGQAESIDNFLFAHKGNKSVTLVGKLLICFSILFAEQRSTLKAQNSRDLPHAVSDAASNTGFEELFQILVRGTSTDDFKNVPNNVKFIIFNYDRALEHYLFNSLQNYYDLSNGEASDLLRRFSFIHPYGQIAPLPWQGDHLPVSYGQDPANVGMWQFTSNILTFNENLVDAGVQNEVRTAISWANQIIFLGFAYHEQNMELLRQPAVDASYPTIFGTVLGESAQSVARVQALIRSCFGNDLGGPSVHLEPQSCREFLANYNRLITA